MAADCLQARRGGSRPTATAANRLATTADASKRWQGGQRERCAAIIKPVGIGPYRWPARRAGWVRPRPSPSRQEATASPWPLAPRKSTDSAAPHQRRAARRGCRPGSAGPGGAPAQAGRPAASLAFRSARRAPARAACLALYGSRVSQPHRSGGCLGVVRTSGRRPNRRISVAPSGHVVGVGGPSSATILAIWSSADLPCMSASP